MYRVCFLSLSFSPFAVTFQHACQYIFPSALCIVALASHALIGCSHSFFPSTALSLASTQMLFSQVKAARLATSRRMSASLSASTPPFCQSATMPRERGRGVTILIKCLSHLLGHHRSCKGKERPWLFCHPVKKGKGMRPSRYCGHFLISWLFKEVI